MASKLSLKAWRASSSPLEVLMVGMGGIGSLYGYLLQRGPQKLAQESQPQSHGAAAAAAAHRSREQCIRMSLVARSNYDAIHENGGVDVQSKKYGTGKLKHDRLYRTVGEAAQAAQAAGGGGYDLIVCTTKALVGGSGKGSTVELLRPAVDASPNACVVVIQNGLGIEEPLHEAFGDNLLIGCTAYTGVWSTSASSVEHAALDRVEAGVYPECNPGAGSEGGSFVIPDPADSGPAAGSRAAANADAAHNTRQREALELFMTLLQAADCDTAVLGSVVAARWRKLVWNASFNPVCAMLDMDTSQVQSCAPAERLVRSCMAEVCAAAKGDGVLLDASAIIEANWTTTKKMMGKYKPSMQLDRAARRQMELQVILGEPIRRAGEKNVPVPTLQNCHDVLSALEWKDAQR